MQAPNSIFQRNYSLKLPKQPDSQSLLKDEVDQLLLTQFAPATLLVNNNSDILAVRGQVNPYISLEPGTPSFSVAKLVRKEFTANYSNHHYTEQKNLGKDVKEILRFEFDGHAKAVNFQVKPLKISNYEEPFFLILFEEIGKSTQLKCKRAKAGNSQVTNQW